MKRGSERLKCFPKATQLIEDNPRLKHEFSPSPVLNQNVMLLLLNAFFFCGKRVGVVDG